MEKTAIVLSGGGSCGAYQIGVWKALRKLKIKYDIVTGTSVGALNGIMMVQDDYSVAHKLWSNIDYNLLFKKFVDVGDKDLKNKDIYLKYIDGFLKNGGMDVTNLELTLADLFDEKKFYNSTIDYGIVVYNLSKLQTEFLTKSQLTVDKVKAYVMASAACYPAFQVKEIDNEKYIDGGYGDNLPLNLAVKMGASKIIAVDLEQIGLKKTIKNKKVQVTYIRPKNDVGSFLIFDKKQAKKNIKYGYNDTLKTYGVLKGDVYTFHNFCYCYFVKKIYNRIKDYVEQLTIDNDSKKKFRIKNKAIKSFLQIQDINSEEIIQDCISVLGKSLEIDDTKVYFIYQFNFTSKYKIDKLPPINVDLIKDKIKNNEINSLLGSKYIVKYIYENLKNTKDVDFNLLYTLFRKEFLAALYLLCL